MVSEKDKGTIEIIRAAWRPILIGMLGVGTFIFCYEEIFNEWTLWWIKLFLFGGGEWIIERPVVKALSGYKK